MRLFPILIGDKMKQYHELLQKVLEYGVLENDRTNTGTLSIFGEKLAFDLTDGFPLLTTKYVSFKNVATELIWFLKGNTSADYLDAMGNTIWKEWTDSANNLPHTYPEQWRNFHDPKAPQHCIDQIANLIEGIKHSPYSRRHVVTAWNPHSVNDAALPPCHILFQVYVRGGKLSLSWMQRSQDVFLGLPYNIASYALLTHIIAHVTGYTADKLIYMGGDIHLYTNHIEPAREQLSRSCDTYKLPTITIAKELTDINNLEYSDLTLNNYNSHPAISAKVAV